MLRQLSIRNFVLVDSVEIGFQSGMTVLTGETGAGKSILVDALSLVLGDRAESGIVRQGAKKAEIGAEFDVAGLPLVISWLEENGLESDSGICIVRRIVEAEGRSRAFINGSAVTLTQLRELGEQLVDIHGQHAHHALSRQSVQRELLDEFAGAQAEASGLSEAWRAWQSANKRLQLAREESSARLLEKEGLESALEEVRLMLEDLRHWDELQSDHRRQAHTSALMEASAQLLDGLEDEETGILHRLNLLRGLLRDMQEKDAGLANEAALLEAAFGNIEELRHEFSRYADRLSMDPERLADLDRRMAEVMRVSRKHRLQPVELLERHAAWNARLAALEAEQDIDALEKAASKAGDAYGIHAGKLSAKRERAARTLAKTVTAAMSELALGDGRFAVKLKPCEPGPHGVEDVSFEVASHASLPLGPLDKVASGGELSRVSLAVQTALSGAAGVPTLIFDEVDVGIGGGVAEAVGRRLAQLASSRQVLVVTHLPQVAACGNQHLRVSKLSGAKVVSRVEQLDREERVTEIARMLGGKEITGITLGHAREMLEMTSPAG